jgi:hypothetical protein
MIIKKDTIFILDPLIQKGANKRQIVTTPSTEFMPPIVAVMETRITVQLYSQEQLPSELCSTLCFIFKNILYMFVVKWFSQLFCCKVRFGD